jgi:hypothetical protein
MKVMLHPPSNMVDVSSDHGGLAYLAGLVASGAGTMLTEDTASPYGEIALTQVTVRTTAGRVRITADTDTRTLAIAGAAEHLEALADALADVAQSSGRGHVHIEHFPDHPYLREESAPLVVSPLSG